MVTLSSCPPGLRGLPVPCSPHTVPLSLVPSRVMTYREHTAWVVKAYLQKHPEGNIMSVRYGLHPGAVCPHSQLVFPFKFCPSSWEGKALQFDICFNN